jgi:hypothetical protein
MPSYLRRRGHTWFFRWKWPSRLAGRGLSGELVQTLKTGDFRVARRRALHLVVQFEAMTTANPMPTRAELEGQVRDWIDACVWRREVHRAETGGFDHLTRPEIERMGRFQLGWPGPSRHLPLIDRLTDPVPGS